MIEEPRDGLSRGRNRVLAQVFSETESRGHTPGMRDLLGVKGTCWRRAHCRIVSATAYLLKLNRYERSAAPRGIPRAHQQRNPGACL